MYRGPHNQAVLVPGPPSRRQKVRAAFVRWGPFGVPLLYAAFVLLAQPSDHLGPPDWAPSQRQTFYDDFDYTAIALRGLNAELGRAAGRTDTPPFLDDLQEFTRRLDEGRPLEPRYYLEYPHTALWIFRLGFAFQPPLPRVPSAVADGSYHNIVYHKPRNDAERELWGRFRTAIRLYLGLMLACMLVLVVVLRAGYEPGGRLTSTGALLLLPSALYFSLNRFDIIPALLTALGLACLGRRRVAASAFCFGVGTMIKVFPLFLVPLVLRYLLPDRRSALRWVLVYGVTLALFLLPNLLLYGWESVAGPYRFQLGREPEKWSVYHFLLPSALGDTTVVGTGFRLSCLALTLAALLWTRPRDLSGLLRRGAVVLIVFMAVQVFYSPQWVLWVLPLVLPLAARERRLAWVLFALDLVTFHTFPVWPPLGEASEFGAEVLFVIRFGILGCLAFLLLRAERRETHPTWMPEPRRAGFEPARS
jgi:hypothetical protein